MLNRHDLKLYASDEGKIFSSLYFSLLVSVCVYMFVGRVQVTAAAFAKGFLDLDGELTPILVSLINRDKSATKLLNDNVAAQVSFFFFFFFFSFPYLLFGSSLSHSCE